jgi:hypothetical protein
MQTGRHRFSWLVVTTDATQHRGRGRAGASGIRLSIFPVDVAYVPVPENKREKEKQRGSYHVLFVPAVCFTTKLSFMLEQ